MPTPTSSGSGTAVRQVLEAILATAPPSTTPGGGSSPVEATGRTGSDVQAGLVAYRKAPLAGERGKAPGRVLFPGRGDRPDRERRGGGSRGVPESAARVGQGQDHGARGHPEAA